MHALNLCDDEQVLGPFLWREGAGSSTKRAYQRTDDMSTAGRPDLCAYLANKKWALEHSSCSSIRIVLQLLSWPHLGVTCHIGHGMGRRILGGCFMIQVQECTDRFRKFLFRKSKRINCF